MGFITISDEQLEKVKKLANPEALKILNGFNSESATQREQTRQNKLFEQEKARKKRRADAEKAIIEKVEQSKKKKAKKKKRVRIPKRLIGDPAPINPFPKTQKYSQPPVPMAITNDHKGPINPRKAKTKSSSRERADYATGLDEYDSFVFNEARHSESFGYGRKKSLEYTGPGQRGGTRKKKRRKNGKNVYDPDYPDRWAIK